MPIIFQAIDSYNSFWPLKPTIVKAIDAHNYLLTIPMTKIPVLFMIISGKNDFGGFFSIFGCIYCAVFTVFTQSCHIISFSLYNSDNNMKNNLKNLKHEHSKIKTKKSLLSSVWLKD